MMKVINKFTVLFLVIALLQTSCKQGSDPCTTTFDQLAMLDNYGNNIILPTYAAFAVQTDSLQTLTDSFVSNPTVATLENLQTKFQQVWRQWQKVAIFEFGPAETEELRSHLNNFPVFISRLEAVLDSSSNDLTTSYYEYIRGLPALDYLLYGIGNQNAAIVAKYTTDSKATNRLNYLQEVVDLIQLKANMVYDAWKPTGANYLNTFVNTDGVENGKPISNLVNQLNQNYELIKNDKIGTPIGAKTGYLANEDNVEALYSRTSLDLAIAAVAASQEVFEGAGGIGLDDYLQATSAQKGNEDLHTLISKQYDLIETQLNGLKPNSWYTAVTTSPTATQAAYAAAQNQVVLMKTDLPAALCISIVYVDVVNDGD